jgi:hypothetical protein
MSDTTLTGLRLFEWLFVIFLTLRFGGTRVNGQVSGEGWAVQVEKSRTEKCAGI